MLLVLQIENGALQDVLWMLCKIFEYEFEVLNIPYFDILVHVQLQRRDRSDGTILTQHVHNWLLDQLPGDIHLTLHELTLAFFPTRTNAPSQTVLAL